MSSALLNILPETKHVPAAERLLKPKTLAIPLLNSDTARYYAYAYTAQLSLYYYLRASALVANPLNTMIQDVVPLATAQCLFCAICLPSVGNWYSGTDASELIKGSATKPLKTSTGSSAQKKKTGKQSTDLSKDAGGAWTSRVLVCHLSCAYRSMLTMSVANHSCSDSCCNHAYCSPHASSFDAGSTSLSYESITTYAATFLTRVFTHNDPDFLYTWGFRSRLERCLCSMATFR